MMINSLGNDELLETRHACDAVFQRYRGTKVYCTIGLCGKISGRESLDGDLMSLV